MPNFRRFAPPEPRHGWRHSARGAGRALSPRGAFALHEVDGAVVFALRAALATGVVAVPLSVAGRPDLAVYATLGSLTTTFGRNLPYARRVRVLSVAALAMTAAVATGSALAVAADPHAGGAGALAVVAATAVVAGIAKFVCDVTRVGGLGAVLLLFAFAVAANGAPAAGDVLPRTGLAAAGAGCAWLLGVAGVLLHPDRPQRLAVAMALRRVADLLDVTGGAAGPATRSVRHRATVAVLHAYHCLGVPPPTRTPRAVPGGQADFVRLTDLAWSLLTGPGGAPAAAAGPVARGLRAQARLLTGRRRRVPPIVDPLRSRSGAPEPHPPEDPGAMRATELLLGRPGGRERLAAAAVPAWRMAIGTGAAGAVAALLGLEHGYWAAISAAAVLHSVNVRTTAQRAVQRTLGTGVGLLLALAVLGLHLAPVTLTVVIVVLEFLLEYVAARNYALAVVFLTPIALLLTELAVPAPAGELVLDRVLGSVVGIAVGLLCALLIVHDRAAVRVERALAECRSVAADAEQALTGPPSPLLPVVQVRLALAVVELREADDTAAGELWPAGIDPTELAAAEGRAYALLGRLRRP
ncbi:FUSC family protein [Streptomyces xanthii]|uniref:FUSC family protein n=1 Tax=Streptomyces xanthii TaxID=2768069 RepID=A0A7H1B1K1_9ACTN|nr:FUSC family protein [Streptomyces xanthii]QNS02606.1 FUSC family protein [Streptomyces xanthii]